MTLFFLFAHGEVSYENKCTLFLVVEVNFIQEMIWLFILLHSTFQRMISVLSEMSEYWHSMYYHSAVLVSSSMYFIKMLVRLKVHWGDEDAFAGECRPTQNIKIWHHFSYLVFSFIFSLSKQSMVKEKMFSVLSEMGIIMVRTKYVW